MDIHVHYVYKLHYIKYYNFILPIQIKAGIALFQRVNICVGV